ncbi:replicative DNA helicase [bacterium]|nr:replicative DNA helicase [bacterium]
MFQASVRRETRLSPKIPPQNIEAEKAVLGAILIDHDSINKVSDLITPEAFYLDSHTKIFSAMLTLNEKSEPTDFLTVSNFLQSQGTLELVGGASYLSSLADSIPSSANVVSYARIIHDRSMVRRLIEASADIATKGYENPDDAQMLIDSAEQIIFSLSENRARSGFANVKDIVIDSFKKIEELVENQKTITGVATGFNDLDNMTCGFQPGDLVIIAARPSMGKTAFALNIAEHAAIREGQPVAIYSLEMSKESLVTRMLCAEARLDSQKLRKGQLEERDWPNLTRAAGHLSEAKIFIDDTASPTVMEMRAKARRLKKEHGVGLIIVDYLQLVRGSAGAQSREQEISEISRSLKALAKELKVPVIALSQLNRAVESRTNRRPQLSDLRESGAIEQDADVISFIYRDEVYNETTPDKGVAEIIIGKQRNGPTGTVRLAFINQSTRFENLAFDNQSQFGAPPPAFDPADSF